LVVLRPHGCQGFGIQRLGRAVGPGFDLRASAQDVFRRPLATSQRCWPSFTRTDTRRITDCP